MKKEKKIYNIDKTKGIYAPVQLSEPLCDFLKISHGSEKTRQEVTKLLFVYIKEHNLQNEKDGRKINPDETLMCLFNIDDKIDFNIFNLQKYLQNHYNKNK